MVYLIAGARDAGKTMRLNELFVQEKQGAWGFCAKKVMQGGQVAGYDLLDLRTGELVPVARLKEFPLCENQEEVFFHDPFQFSKKAFRWARKLFAQARQYGVRSFFIDELGKIELQGGGHFRLVHRAVQADIALYIAIRDSYVEEAARIFCFENVTVVPV